jgi:putative protease
MPWYLDQISRCTYRQFTTGFYFGKPSEEAQIYDNNTYINEYIYLGIVYGIDERGYAQIEQRNKFSVGDEIEIMKPDGTDVKATVRAMFNADNEAVESCPHSKETIYLDLSEKPSAFDILRIESK